MQKKIISMAIAGLVSSFAFAQTNVTVYGIIDQGYAFSAGKNAVGDKIKRNGIDDGGTGGLNGSRLGFRGEEALGNGLKTIFTVEYGFNADTYTPALPGTVAVSPLTNMRQSWVGLSGNFGAVTMGRQYAPSGRVGLGEGSANGLIGYGAANTFTGQFVAIDNAGNNSRINNSIAYASPVMSGFQAHAIYGFGEQVRSSFDDSFTDQSFIGVGGSYGNGPVKLAAVYQKRLADDNIANNDGVAAWGVLGSYDFKVVKLHATYWREKDERTVNEQTKKLWALGVSAPVFSAGRASLEYSQFKNDDINDGKAKGLTLSYVHDLSKRTAVYATLTRINNDDGLNLARNLAGMGNGENVTQFSTGIRHMF